jgi:hypothetical protein
MALASTKVNAPEPPGFARPAAYDSARGSVAHAGAGPSTAASSPASPSSPPLATAASLPSAVAAPAS